MSCNNNKVYSLSMSALQTYPCRGSVLPASSATTAIIGRRQKKEKIFSRLGLPGANRLVVHWHRKMVEMGPERTVIGGAAEGYTSQS
jgi:hypothetical protein